MEGIFTGNHQIDRKAQGSNLADEAVGFLVTVLQLGLNDEEIQVASLAGIAARRTRTRLPAIPLASPRESVWPLR